MKLTRRELLQGVTGLAMGSGLLRAQENYPGLLYRDYSRCLPDYLSSLARAAYEKRNSMLSRLTTPEAIRERQLWVRKTFWELVGGQPERTPLNVRELGSLDRPGYQMKKILYESQPGLLIPANLYVPTEGKAPYPGILFQMGHSLNGKANASYQSCCQGLARLGFVVLAFDPMGQGERTYYPEADGTLTRFGSADDEHTVPGKQMLLVGHTSTRLQVWDAIRSLDYLASLPQVDPSRLASTGQSGGATLTMLLMAADDRLAAAAVSSGNTENVACADFNPPGATDDAEQNFVDGAARGFGRWDLFYPMAPRPVLVMVSARDFFGTYSPRYISNGWEEFQKLRKVYTVLGQDEHLQWTDTPLPHGLSYDFRLAIYNWLRRWLQGIEEPLPEEPYVSPEVDEALWVSSTGNVVRSFGSETPGGLTLRHFSTFQVPKEPRQLESLLQLEPPNRSAGFTELGSVDSPGQRIRAVEVPTATGVWVPAWLFEPRTIDPEKKPLLILEPQGRNSRWREGQLYQELARNGQVVCVPDIRGIGDMTPEFPRGAVGHGSFHQEEENYAWSSLILGRTLLGQRVKDILSLVGCLRRMESGSHAGVVVAARGKQTVPALFAAALEPSIIRLYLAEGLLSFRNLLETEVYNYPFANFLPNLLHHTDLPELAASLAPRVVEIAGTVDAAGKQLDSPAVEEVYGTAENIRVRREALWDFSTLSTISG